MVQTDPLNLAGHTLSGTYELAELIGEGGFGCVYRGRHVLLKRECAVKVLKDLSSAESTAFERFRREAELCSRLKGAGVVEVTDARLDPATGRFFFVMELLQGQSLRDYWIERKKLPVEEAAGYISRVGEYMVVAHAHGVVHRDLTPSNIFLCEDGAIRVLDFGAALIKSEARLTSPGVPIGTTLYVPEEQLLEPTGAMDGRVDVYALGVVLYHLISNHPIYPPKEPVRIIGGRVVREDPVDIQKVAAAVKEPLAKVIRRAIARNRDHRYASMRDFVMALRDATGIRGGDLAAPTIQAPPPAALLQVCAASSSDELPKTVKVVAPALAGATIDLEPILHQVEVSAATPHGATVERPAPVVLQSAVSAPTPNGGTVQRPAPREIVERSLVSSVASTSVGHRKTGDEGARAAPAGRQVVVPKAVAATVPATAARSKRKRSGQSRWPTVVLLVSAAAVALGAGGLIGLSRVRRAPSPEGSAAATLETPRTETPAPVIVAPRPGDAPSASPPAPRPVGGVAPPVDVPAASTVSTPGSSSPRSRHHHRSRESRLSEPPPTSNTQRPSEKPSRLNDNGPVNPFGSE